MPKILVADDNANIQKMVMLAFQDQGIQVVAVPNGEAAVRRVPDLDPDLVLADIFMPVRNGYEVCEFIKKDERFSHIPVILLVGAFDPLDEKEARRVGADGVLKKPFIPPDPLIAMVMAALEKNPRVAAELAKAREAKQAPEPHPIAHLEAPSRPEPKPLPHFPEPSPEEAALVYGFGSGRRALDRDKADAQDQELVEASDEAGDAAFDSAATARDWRRTAMDFEVPALDANRPAFSSDDDLEPVTFPSEHEAPARNERVMEPAGEIDSSVQDQEFVTPQADPPVATLSDDSAAPVVGRPLAPVVDAEVSFEPAPENQSQSNPPARTAHWMDAVTPRDLDHPQGDWMSALSVAPIETVTATPMEDRSIDSLALRASPIEAAEASAEVDGSGSEARAEATDVPSATPFETREEPFWADEAVSSPRTDSWFAPAPRAGEPSQALESDAASGAFRADQDLEAEPGDSAAPVAFRDPGLVEPPAVHVTPEPLLVDDEPQAASEYGSRAGDVSAEHPFFAPPSEDAGEKRLAAQEISADDESGAETFGAWASEQNERIPTSLPPNREALAEIPFLTPPAGFDPDSPEVATTNSEAVNVDDLVRMVLEKLEPHLHQLLSQGVLKPIVENILQNEHAKKETTR